MNRFAQEYDRKNSPIFGDNYLVSGTTVLGVTTRGVEGELGTVGRMKSRHAGSFSDFISHKIPSPA